MTPARRELPALSLGSLSYNPKTKTLEEVCKDAAARNVTINPDYGNLTDSAIAALALRGFSVYPWTYYAADALTNGYYSGCMGLTTSDVTFAAPIFEAIESMDLYSNRYVLPQAVARTVSGEKKTVTAEIVATDMLYASEAGKIVAAENGRYPAVLRIAFTAYGKTFVLQEKTTVSVTTYVEPQPEEPPPIEPPRKNRRPIPNNRIRKNRRPKRRRPRPQAAAAVRQTPDRQSAEPCYLSVVYLWQEDTSNPKSDLPNTDNFATARTAPRRL